MPIYRFTPIEGNRLTVAVVANEEYMGNITINTDGAVTRCDGRVSIDARRAFYEWCAKRLLVDD